MSKASDYSNSMQRLANGDIHVPPTELSHDCMDPAISRNAGHYPLTAFVTASGWLRFNCSDIVLSPQNALLLADKIREWFEEKP